MDSADLSSSDDSLDPTDKVPLLWSRGDEIDDRPTPAPAPTAVPQQRRPIPGIVRRDPAALAEQLKASRVERAPAQSKLPATVMPPRATTPPVSAKVPALLPAPVPAPVVAKAEIAVAPPEPAPAPPSQSGTSTLRSHKARAKRGVRRTSRPRERDAASRMVDASADAPAFGASMLQAHKVGAVRASESSPAQWTFGAGVLQTRKRGGKLVAAIVIALAAVAVVCLVARGDANRGRTAAAASHQP